MKSYFVTGALLGTLLLGVPAVYAQQNQAPADDQQIYGSHLMTPEERAEYRDRMRAARTAEEREQIRREHHAQMQERARAQGLALPDEPLPRGSGRGAPQGPGMGPGGGMGPGRSR